VAKWVNRTLVQAARNGTTSHTISFTAATAGNLLVAVLDGAVTSTTPTGWTLPTNGSAINNTGLYVWTKTATAGESSFSTTHNASNYPVGAVVYEFPAGSTFVKAATATALAHTAASPTISSLTGTNLLMSAVAEDVPFTGGTAQTTWTGATEDTDVFALNDTTNDGYLLSIGYSEDSTATSYAPTGSTSGTGTLISKEALTWAINVAVGSPGGGTTYAVAVDAAHATLAESASATALTVPVPSTAVAGDLLLLAVTVGGTGTIAATLPGWTTAKTQATGTNVKGGVYYRVCTGLEGTSVSLTGLTTVAEKVSASMIRLTGASTTTPLEVVASATPATTSTIAMAPVTTLNAGAAIIYLPTIDAASSSDFSTPAGVTSITDSTGTGKRLHPFYELQAAAGTSTTRTFTVTGTTGVQVGGITVAVRAGSPVSLVAGAIADNAGITDASITVPAGVTPNHLGFIVVATQQTSQGAGATAPTGWVPRDLNSAGANNTTGSVYIWSRLGGVSAGDTLTVAIPSNSNASTSVAFYDTGGRDIAKVSAPWNNGGADVGTATFSAPGHTGSGDVLLVLGNRTTTGTWAAPVPAGPVLDYQVKSPGGFNCGAVFAHSTGATSQAFTSTLSASNVSHNITTLQFALGATATPYLRSTAVAGAGQTAGTTSLSLTVPAGVQDGDVALVEVHNSSTTATLTTPAGWTLVSGRDTITSQATWLLARTLLASDASAAVSLAFSASARCGASMAVIANATTIGMQTATASTTTAATTQAIPSLASVPAGSLFATLYARRSGTTTADDITPPTGTNDAVRVVSAYSTAPQHSGEIQTTEVFAAGAVGGGTATTSVSSTGFGYGVSLPAAVLPLTETWTGTTGTAWPVEWTTTAAGATGSSATIQANAGSFTYPSVSSFSLGPQQYLAGIPAAGDVDITATVTFAQIKEEYLWIMGRAAADASYGYGLNLYPGNGSLSAGIVRFDTGGLTNVGGDLSAGTWTANVARKIRVQIIGDTIRVKVWDASGSEPGTWLGTQTDTYASGKAGKVIVSVMDGATTTGGTVTVDDLTVSTPAAVTGITGTGTLSGSGTLASGTGTPALAQTVALTGSGGLGGTPTLATAKGTAALSGSGSIGNVVTQSFPLGFAGTGTLTVGTRTPAAQGTPALSGSGTMTAPTRLPNPTQTVALTGSGTLVAPDGLYGYLATADLSGTGALVQVVLGTAALTGDGGLTSADGGLGGLARPTLSGAGTLVAGVGTPGPRWVQGLLGTGLLAVTATPRTPGVGALVGSGALTVIETERRTVALSATGTLGVGSRTPALASLAALSGAGTLALGSPLAGLRGGAGLSGSGTLAFGTGIYGFRQTPALSGLGALSTVARTGQTGAGPFAGVGALTVGVLAGPRTTAALSGAGTLIGTGGPAALRSIVLSGAGTLSTPGGAPGLLLTPVLAGTGTLAVVGRVGLITSPSASLTGTLSLLTFTGIPGGRGAGVLAGTGTLSAGGTPVEHGTATPGGQGFLSVATGVPTPGVSCVTFGSGTLLGTPALSTARGGAVLAGLGALTPGGGPNLRGLAALGGIGTLSTRALPGGIGAATLGATGVLAIGSIGLRLLVTPALSGSGALVVAVTPRPVVGLYYALSGSGTLTFASGIYGFTQTPALTGSGALASAASARLAALTALVGAGTLSVTRSAGPSATAATSGTGTLATGTRAPNLLGTTTFTGLGTLGGTQVGATVGGAASSTGLGTLTVADLVTLSGQATLAATGQLRSLAQVRTTGTAAAFMVGTLTIPAAHGVIVGADHPVWITAPTAPPAPWVRPASPDLIATLIHDPLRVRRTRAY
jgi:hypothetical protein